ncbi:sodium/calcium exchanger NCL2-like protein [Tanacetum coccineum]
MVKAYVFGCWVGCKILGESLGELEDCISLVRDQVPIRDGTDSWQWMLEDGGFTVKVLKVTVGEKVLGPRSQVEETKWCRIVPRKVNVFMWRLKCGQIPVRTLIDNIGMDFHSTLCPHCEEAIETIDHNTTGKTTILYRLHIGDVLSTIPTIAFNVDKVEYKNVIFTIWDVGGQQKLRPLWRHYFNDQVALKKKYGFTAGGENPISLDVNKDGFVLLTELKKLMTRVNFGETSWKVEETTSRMMQNLDTNGDKEIDEEEFVHGFEKKLKACEKWEDDNVDRSVWGWTKALMLLALGLAMLALMAEPLIHSVQNVSNSAAMSPFFILFILVPLATNAKAAISAIRTTIMKSFSNEVKVSNLAKHISNPLKCLSPIISHVDIGTGDHMIRQADRWYVVPTGRVIATDSVIVASSGYIVPAAYDIRPGSVK